MNNIKQSKLNNVYNNIKKKAKEKSNELDSDKEKCSYNSIFAILSAVAKEKEKEN